MYVQSDANLFHVWATLSIVHTKGFGRFVFDGACSKCCLLNMWGPLHHEDLRKVITANYAFEVVGTKTSDFKHDWSRLYTLVPFGTYIHV